MNIFEALRADHDTQRTLAGLLVKTRGDSEGRRELFERLKDALERHADAEERHFYVHLMEHDLTQQEARHGVAEHHQLDKLIAELEAMDLSSPAWLPKARELCEKVEHHLEDEEHGIFQLAGKVLSDTQKRDLARRYRAQMDDRQAA